LPEPIEPAPGTPGPKAAARARLTLVP